MTSVMCVIFYTEPEEQHELEITLLAQKTSTTYKKTIIETIRAVVPGTENINSGNDVITVFENDVMMQLLILT